MFINPKNEVFYAIATLVSVVAMYLKVTVFIHQLRYRRETLELDNEKSDRARASLLKTQSHSGVLLDLRSVALKVVASLGKQAPGPQKATDQNHTLNFVDLRLFVGGLRRMHPAGAPFVLRMLVCRVHERLWFPLFRGSFKLFTLCGWRKRICGGRSHWSRRG